MNTLWMWLGFNLFVLLLLALDLGVLHRKGQEVGIREALWLSFGYFVLALLFGAGVWHFLGRESGVEFFTGYLLSARTSITVLCATTSLTLSGFIAVCNQIPRPGFCPGRVSASAL